jgi:hypothetical protein
MADEGIQLDTRVTPSFQSANIRALPEYDADTAPLFGPVESAFDLAYRTVSSIHTARDAAQNDLTLTEAARVVKTADFADSLMERTTRAFDQADTILKNNIASLELSLSAPVQARAAHTISVEIRAHVKGLKAEGGSILDFVQRAIDSGDHDTVSAVLGSPAYLSGMTPEQQSVMLRRYHERSNPQTAKRLAAAKAAQAYLGRNSGLLFREIEKGIGGDYRKVQMLRKGANASKKAFGV